MFDETSRYARLKIKTWVFADGREAPYVERRIIPRPESLEIAARARVRPGDRLDLVAERAYADGRAFWRIADANPTLDPETLTDMVGRLLAVPMIKPE
jgi:hypothetical protein